MLKLGLTGGIASGKSTVARFMQQEGAIVIDADHIAHDLMTPSGWAYPAVIEAFGPEILNSDQSIDRPKLGELVFSNPDALALLNQIVHPLVRMVFQSKEADLRAEETQQGKNYLLVMMIPLLFESKLEDTVDQTVVVYCPAQDQLERLIKRNGLSELAAQQRMAAQLPLEAKLARADHIIDNSRDLSWTQHEVERILGALKWDIYEPASVASS